MEGPEFLPPSVGTSYRDPNQKRASRKPFATKPGQAVPVWQRASSDGALAAFTVGINPLQILRLSVGRYMANIWVPTSYGSTSLTYGVLLGSDPGPLMMAFQSNQAVSGAIQLNVGDALPWYSEAPLWCLPIYGQTTGIVQLTEFFNPAVLDPSDQG